MFEPPIRTFIVGVLLAEGLQFAGWLRKRGPAAWRGYVLDQPGTILGNMVVNVAVGMLWSYGALDVVLAKVAAWIPGSGDWATSGLPFTPPVGLGLGIGCDFFGDDLAFHLWALARGALQRVGVIDGEAPAVTPSPPPPSSPTGG